MDIDHYWDFFSHTTNFKKLIKILNEQYEIDCDDIEVPANVNEIYQISLELCENLVQLPYDDSDFLCPSRITDKKFFSEWSIKDDSQDYHLFQYLCVDALFHIEKEMELTEHMTIYPFFENTKDYLIDLSQMPDYGNFADLRKKDFMESIYAELLGLLSEPKHTPKFMDRLLSLLIHRIKKNPYCKAQDSSFESLRTFFLDFFHYVSKLYPEEKDKQYIANYLAYRLFPVHTITFVSQVLSELKLPVDSNMVLDAYLPLFFLPNVFSAPFYLELTLFKLPDCPVSTVFDEMFYPEEKNKPITSNFDIIQNNLLKHRKYFLFMDTVYFPVLSSCFYVLLKKAFSSDLKTIKKQLVHALDSIEKSSTVSLEDYWKSDIELFMQSEKKNFTDICSKIKAILSNPDEREYWKAATSLDYISSTYYQPDILRIVVKQKFDTNFMYPQYVYDPQEEEGVNDTPIKLNPETKEQIPPCLLARMNLEEDDVHLENSEKNSQKMDEET